MGITIEQLAGDARLGLRIVGGLTGRRRDIAWAHTSELIDPTAWLEGGELLMTLGLNVPDDPVEQRAYVARLASIGAAGLAFDTGMIHSSVPEALAQAGDEFGLPVLAIPGATPFLAISRAVISAITADQVALVAQISRNQERLASAAMLKGAAGVVESLARILGATVLTLDGAAAVAESAGAGSTRLARRATTLLTARRGKRAASLRQPTFSHVDDEGYFTVQVLGKPKQAAGFLVVGGRRQLDSNQRLLVSHAATLLSILLDRPAHLHEAEMRLRRMLFRSLLRPGSDTDLGLLRYVGFAPDHQVAVVAVADAGPPRAAEAAVDAALAARGTPALVMANSKGLAVLAGASERTEVARVALEALRERLGRMPSAGVGRGVDLALALDSYRQAIAAARVAVGQPGQVVDFAALSIFDLLLGTQSRDTLAAIAGSVLRPLDPVAAGAHGDLLRTTAEFLAHGGHWEATASSLGVHRHTLRNRIDRISGILGRDLTLASERAEVWLALKARELLNLTAAEAVAEGMADGISGSTVASGADGMSASDGVLGSDASPRNDGRRSDGPRREKGRRGPGRTRDEH